MLTGHSSASRPPPVAIPSLKPTNSQQEPMDISPWPYNTPLANGSCDLNNTSQVTAEPGHSESGLLLFHCTNVVAWSRLAVVLALIRRHSSMPPRHQPRGRPVGLSPNPRAPRPEC